MNLIPTPPPQFGSVRSRRSYDALNIEVVDPKAHSQYYLDLTKKQQRSTLSSSP